MGDAVYAAVRLQGNDAETGQKLGVVAGSPEKTEEGNHGECLPSLPPPSVHTYQESQPVRSRRRLPPSPLGTQQAAAWICAHNGVRGMWSCECGAVGGLLWLDEGNCFACALHSQG